MGAGKPAQEDSIIVVVRGHACASSLRQHQQGTCRPLAIVSHHCLSPRRLYSDGRLSRSSSGAEGDACSRFIRWVWAKATRERAPGPHRPAGQAYTGPITRVWRFELPEEGPGQPGPSGLRSVQAPGSRRSARSEAELASYLSGGQRHVGSTADQGRPEQL